MSNSATSEESLDLLFEYPRLDDPRHIRLVRASTNEGIPDGIRCEFVHVSLDQLPCEYVAISYCWGDPTPIDRVWCYDRRYLNIASSAGSVLRAMIATKAPGYIWIDALCIDQTNNREKAEQVRLMREVYATAKKVIAWLGESTSDSVEALNFVIRLKDTLLGLHQAGHPITPGNLFQKPLCDYPSFRWKALIHFLQRPWFHRIWIIQEVATAASVQIICGDRETEWGIVAAVVVDLQRNGLGRLLRVARECSPPRDYQSIQCVYSFRRHIRLGSPLTLEAALHKSRIFEATDARDKVFALLGVVSDGGAASHLSMARWTGGWRPLFKR